MKRIWQLLPIPLAMACCGQDDPQWPADIVLKCLPEMTPAEIVQEALTIVTADSPEEALADLGRKYGPVVALCSAREAARRATQRSVRGADELRSAISATGVQFQED